MGSSTQERKKGGRKALRLVLGIFLAVIIAGAAAFAVYVSDYYHADETAAQALVSDGTVTVTRLTDTLTVFAPEDPRAGLIFYPGGKVEHTAYAPLLRACARRGVLCVLVRMPCNLAVLNADGADGVRERFPEIDRWYIGGHSLGGAMAASYAAKHAEDLDGLVLLAAYSTEDLTRSGLAVCSITGSEDGVLNREKYDADRANLPADTVEIVLDGGCHAGFGSYGPQAGDGTPRISGAEQVEQTADALARMMIP